MVSNLCDCRWIKDNNLDFLCSVSGFWYSFAAVLVFCLLGPGVGKSFLGLFRKSSFLSQVFADFHPQRLCCMEIHLLYRMVELVLDDSR